MATSAIAIITSALQLLGIYDPQEAITGADTELGMAELQNMLDSWANEYLFIYDLTNITATMVNAQSAYNVGPGLAFNAPRPSRISYGPGVATYTQSGTVYPVDTVSRLEWANLYQGGGTGIPTIAYYDPQFPTGVISVAPTPGAPNTGTLSVPAWTQFTGFATDATLYTFAPGIDLAMINSLAILLKPYFADAQLDPIVAITAAQTTRIILATNPQTRAVVRTPPAPQAPAKAA